MIIAAVATSAPSTIDTAFTNPLDLVRTRVGETFVIVLDANPTTGYSWSVVDSAGSRIANVGSAFLRPESGRVGAGGKQILLFRATSPGAAALTFRYVRPFDSATFAGAKTAVFHVVVAAS
jgi:predicted secreted protein